MDKNKAIGHHDKKRVVFAEQEVKRTQGAVENNKRQKTRKTTSSADIDELPMLGIFDIYTDCF